MPDLEMWRREIRLWGLARFAWAYLMNFLERWIRVMKVRHRALGTVDPIEPIPEGMVIRFANRAELMIASKDPEMLIEPAFVDAAIARGDLCIAVFFGDRMVSYCWKTYTTAPVGDGLWVGFEKPYCYGYNAFTHPDFRGRHLRENASSHFDPISIAKGCSHNIGYVACQNWASLASGKRKGRSETVGWIGYVKLFGRAYPFRSPGAAAHTIRFYRKPDTQPRMATDARS